MEKANWLVAKARWLAFIPAIWMSSIVHKGVLVSFGPLPYLTSYNPPESFVTKVGFLWGISEGLTVISAMLFAVLVGPPRSPLFQIVMITLCYASFFFLGTALSPIGEPPALNHAERVDLWTGLIVSLLILCGALVRERRVSIAAKASELKN
jgi:hypothetical protein